MRINAKTRYLNEPAKLVFAFYGDRSMAILLHAIDGEPLATATVCIADYGFTPPEGHVVVKDYSENEGMLACLIAQGVVTAPTEHIPGPNNITFPVCALTETARLATLNAEP